MGLSQVELRVDVTGMGTSLNMHAKAGFGSRVWSRLRAPVPPQGADLVDHSLIAPTPAIPGVFVLLFLDERQWILS